MMRSEERYFDLQKKSVIWIYGAGKLGEKCCRSLLESGYKVDGFLDKNADSIGEICGRRVFSPNEAKNIVPQNAIVIICLLNGLSQETVAEKLAEIGLCKLIYVPMHIRQSLSVREQYRKNYECLCNGDFAHIKGVPVFGYETNYPECVIIEKNSTKITFWCGTIDLHTGLFEDNVFARGRKTHQYVPTEYADKEIEDFYPYMELFRYLKGEGIDFRLLELYMKIQGKGTQEEKKQLLDDRKALYQVYEQAYKYEMGFFTGSPSICKWNARGYFQLLDGMHRAIYLISKGYKKVPIAVTRSDFEKYVHFRSQRDRKENFFRYEEGKLCPRCNDKEHC